jgi:transglutaminase-like putative cysteine protease
MNSYNHSHRFCTKGVIKILKLYKVSFVSPALTNHHKILYTEIMNRNRWWDIPSIFCLLIILWISSLRLEATHWAVDLARVELGVIMGTTIGLILGYTSLRSYFSIPICIITSLGFIPWQLALTERNVLSSQERWHVLAADIISSLHAFFNNQPVESAVLFMMGMLALYWTIGLLGGFQMARHGKPWLAVITAGITLAIIDYYHPYLNHPYRYSGTFVFFTLLLMGRLYYLRSSHNWKDRGIVVDYDTGYGMGRSMVIAGLLLVLVSWNVPMVFDIFRPGTPAQGKAITAWEGVWGRLSNLVMGLENSGFGSSELRSDLTLGSGAAQGDSIVFTMELQSPHPGGVRFYWRGYEYDYYVGGQWSSTGGERISMTASAWPLAYPEWDARQEVNYTFNLVTPFQRTFFVAGEPVIIKHVSLLTAEKQIDETYNVITLSADPAMRSGETFSITSWISVPSISQLQSAGTNYPEWVKDTYLQIPLDMPERMAELSHKITDDQDTPYAKTMAITSYLRREIAYQATMAPSPLGREPLDWFLFDYKNGFCNYYASTEVMLLRMVGIPARLAVGFSQGDPDGIQKYVVRYKHSHAWPEVFFPGYGWVDFEPTVSQPATYYPFESQLSLDDDDLHGGTIHQQPTPNTGIGPANPEPGIPQDVELGQTNQTRFLIWAGIILVLVVVIIAIWLILRRNPATRDKSIPRLIESGMKKWGLIVPRLIDSWASRTELHPLERYFSEVSWMLQLAGSKIQHKLTPAEQITELIEVFPILKEHANLLLAEYHKGVYSQHAYNLSVARKARNILWRQLLSALIERFLGIKPKLAQET